MAAKTHLFNCLSDNFGVLIHDPQTGATASIDAPEAAAVDKALKVTGWTLTDILVTHHHNDHTAGVAELKQKHKCRVVGPTSDKFKAVDETIGEGGRVKVGNLTARVLETPGHTLDHICYIFDSEKIAFLADTLFSVGCGRVIEGTMPQMWHSLLKLRALPDDMTFHCGHEYTLANIRFALTIEPDNADLKARAKEADALRAAGKPTLPSTIGAEKKTNCFLRADVPSVAASVGMTGKSAEEVFAEIRTRKNKF